MAQQVPSLAGERPRVMGVAKNKQTNKQARDEEAAFPVFCSCTFMVSVLSLIFKPFFLGQAKGLQKLWGQGASPSPAGPPGRSPWLSPEPILSGFCVWGASGAQCRPVCGCLVSPPSFIYGRAVLPRSCVLAPCQGLAHGFSKTILSPHPSDNSQVSDVLWSVDGDLSCGVGSVPFP